MSTLRLAARDQSMDCLPWEEKLKMQSMSHVDSPSFSAAQPEDNAELITTGRVVPGFSKGTELEKSSLEALRGHFATRSSNSPELRERAYLPCCSSSDGRDPKEIKFIPRPGGSESSSNLEDIEVSFQEDHVDYDSYGSSVPGTRGVQRVEQSDIHKQEHALGVEHAVQKFNPLEMPSQGQMYSEYFFHHFPQSQTPMHPERGFRVWETWGRGLVNDSGLPHPADIHSFDKPCKCPICGKCFSNNSYLIIHTRSHTGERPYVCDVCGERFTRSNHLNDHRRTHSGDKPYRCDVCGEKFAKSGNLNEHKRKHSGERPYKCDLCDKSFARCSVLYRHRVTHSKERPFVCDICDKTFTRKGALRRHERVHSGEKPFHCDICNKSFAHSESLTNHKAIHTGEKHYRCDVCDKRFGNRLYLYSHKKIHSEERPYVCNECGDAFKRSGDLNSHKATHSAEKPFMCDLCDKRFTKSSNLHRHKRLHLAKSELVCDAREAAVK
ncbi:hypothetical protein RRG08_045388 [Elysia crispata]|uniref:C2H2-type domain-containing protein n=1 Tax=Elysia crispata TaxID=231223 RepID=A0AAE0YAU9_9GAST|nr:hypothetical protein RRG08_045388 [Elysia crispata]